MNQVKAYSTSGATAPLAATKINRRLPTASDVQIEILFCGVCHSDLHFARNEAHFRAMLAELWRVLKPGGMLFCRLGSRIGMEFHKLRPNIYRIGDGSEWFLVDEPMLMRLTEERNAVLVDPLKTTIVQSHRCMTTWVLRKRKK